MPFCPECGKSVGPSQKFCRNCGASLIEELPAAVPPAPSPGTLSCRTCGALLAPDEKFCGNCGTTAGDAPAAAAPGSATPPPYPAATVPVTAPIPAPEPALAVTPVAAGQPAVLVCLSCGTPMTADMKFCGCCGAPAQAAAVSPALPAYQAPPASYQPPPPPPPSNTEQPVAHPVVFSSPPGSISCRACGYPLRPGDKVCRRCFVKVMDTAGVTQAVHTTPPLPSVAAVPGGYVCASCGSLVSGSEKFCGICGAAVVAARAPATPPAAVAPTVPSGKFCGHCGGAISSTTKFCGSCGTSVNTSPK